MPDPELLVSRVTMNYCQVFWQENNWCMIQEFSDEKYSGDRVVSALKFCQGLLDEGKAYIFQDFPAPKMMEH